MHIKIDDKLGSLILESFKIVDENGDGFINQEQFKVLWRSLGQVISDANLNNLVQESFNKLDDRKEMDISTFVDIFSSKYVHPPSSKSIYDAFNILGINTANDLRNVLSKGDDKLTDEQINRFFKLGNLKGNSFLDYTDLVNLFTNKNPDNYVKTYF